MRKVLVIASSLLLTALALSGQTRISKNTVKQTAGGKSAEDMNIRAYIELLRVDVRKEKAAIVGEVMDLSAEDAAKFWPVYKEYEAEVTRTGDQKLAGIKKYAQNYDNMSDAVANELAQAALKIELERHQIKTKYYERVKEELGAITAARFLQVENQLLMLLDLQVAALLPVIQEHD